MAVMGKLVASADIEPEDIEKASDMAADCASEALNYYKDADTAQS